MANNIPALKTELLTLLTNTTNLDATTKQKLRDAFVTQYPQVYTVWLNGQSDTAARRAEFAVEMTFRHWRQTVEDASYKANVAALPTPDTIN